jgi:hypothetical protein
VRELEPGDHIQIGDCVFQYSASEAKAPQAIAPAGIVMQSTVRLQQGDQRLEALIRAATAFGALESAEAVSEALLESIFAVLPAAEKGAVIRASRPLTKSAARIVGRDRAGEMVGPVAISLTAVNQVLAEGTALLSNEVLADGRVMTSGSLGGTSAQVRRSGRIGVGILVVRPLQSWREV